MCEHFFIYSCVNGDYLLLRAHFFREDAFLLDTQSYTFFVFSTLKVPLAPSTLLTHTCTLPNEQNITCWRKCKASDPPGKKNEPGLPEGMWALPRLPRICFGAMHFEILCVWRQIYVTA